MNFYRHLAFSVNQNNRIKKEQRKQPQKSKNNHKKNKKTKKKGKAQNFLEGCVAITDDPS